VPLLPGSGLLSDAGHAQAEAARIGYPVMLKSTAGGGGIGMRLIWSSDELVEAFQSVERLARANFKEAGIFLEKYVEHARHIEVQIFGDGAGTSSRWASATARCSGATRRSSRKPRRRA
jgi:urea carboxylase